MGYYKIPIEHLIVIHDDIDQPFNQMKIHKNRGHGGHNGIKSISQLLGTQDYARLKLGVGRPENPNFPVAEYVLGKFSKEEFEKMPDFLNKGIDAVEAIILDGIQKASTKFNT
jgi:PTH1 family peptidyl-tRNA hydrolase